jgi:hypothetical protein
MALSTLERTRSNHEDLEHFETALIQLLQDEHRTVCSVSDTNLLGNFHQIVFSFTARFRDFFLFAFLCVLTIFSFLSTGKI